MLWMALAAFSSAASDELPVITVGRDNIRITESCRLDVTAEPIIDADGDGVIHVVADDVMIEFGEAALRGAEPNTDPDAYTGIGIRITGARVTLRNVKVQGFKVGVYASDADGLTIDGGTFTDNFRQRLRSTAAAEDTADWLRPHENDANEWMHRYGAAIYVEQSLAPVIRDVHVRDTQNGIILDTCRLADVYDNDCSFLSGWGAALWRCTQCRLTHNAFDFCVRGYSHGVYNRGQDSAGILMFEQCRGNVMARNSVTHGGDGFFGFAGREALGQVDRRDDLSWYEQRGNQSNLLFENDFSYAAAHGVETTFSTRNVLRGNRIVGNAICGIWAGYSREAEIADNRIAENGEMGYGLERGGINAEHAQGLSIFENTFRDNACGIHIWSDDDEAIAALPWATANGTGARYNLIVDNSFSGDEIALQLRRADDTSFLGNHLDDVGVEIDADEYSRQSLAVSDTGFELNKRSLARVSGSKRPVGARQHLRGREHIIMTEWGPYDWDGPAIALERRDFSRHDYCLLGDAANVDDAAISVEGDVRSIRRDDRLIIQPNYSQSPLPYEITVSVDDEKLRRSGVVSSIAWEATTFRWTTDPREDVEAWRAEARRGGINFPSKHLDLRFGHGGPSDIDWNGQVTVSQLPPDRFGNIATTTVTIPKGTWRLKTLSDDGIRVWMDGEMVIDDWTHHGPTWHHHEFTVEDVRRDIEVRVEHFELDGYAVLSVDFEPVERSVAESSVDQE